MSQMLHLLPYLIFPNLIKINLQHGSKALFTNTYNSPDLEGFLMFISHAEALKAEAPSEIVCTVAWLAAVIPRHMMPHHWCFIPPRSQTLQPP
jgi:hypothetical protein